MNKKTVIIIAAGLLFLVGALGAGFYLIWNKISTLENQAQATVEGEEPATGGEAVATQVGPVLDLSTFIVNLSDEDLQRFLKTSIAVEMDSEDGLEEANRRMPQIKDHIVTLLPTKTSKEILSAEGKNVLRTQLMEGLNGLLSTGRITALYFTDFVIQ
jgi:flagellar FliL protein